MASVYSIPLCATDEFDGHNVNLASIRSSHNARTYSQKQSVFLLEHFFADGRNRLLRGCYEWSKQEQPGFWPLVFYGPSGVGKTSLAETFASRFADAFAERAIKITGSDFRRRFDNSVRTKSVSEFRETIDNVFLLLIDDLASIATDGAMREITQLVDRRGQDHRPTVITMKNPPWKEAALPVQLRSRLAGGLTIHVQEPGGAARREIIRQLCQKQNLKVDHGGIELLAASLPSTVPLMQRDLNNIFLRAKHQNVSELSSSLLDSLLDRQYSIDPDQWLPVISSIVAAHFGLSLQQLIGASRRQNIVQARSLAMFLAKQKLAASYVQIAKYFHRDQSTVRYLYRKIDSSLPHEAVLADLVIQLGSIIDQEVEKQN